MTELWFMDDLDKTMVGELHIMPEGNDEEEIAYVQKVLGDAVPYSTLYEMDEDEFMAFVQRTQRTEYCGKIWRWIFQVDGSMRKMSYVCGNWRYCDNCRAQRIKKYRGRVLSALIEKRKHSDSNGLLIITRATPYLRRLIGKEHYICFPDSITVTDLDSIDDKPIDGTFVSYDDLEALDWSAIVDTPPNRRISGALGRPEEKEDNRIPIDAQSIVVKGESLDDRPIPSHIQEAYNWAIDKVSSYTQIDTVYDIENAILSLAMAFRDKVKELGKEEGRTYIVHIQNWCIRAEAKEVQQIIGIASWKAIQAKQRTQIPWALPMSV